MYNSSILPEIFSTYFDDHGQIKIGIIGLGYVGLPLSIEFAKKFNVTGYDINSERIAELKRAEDVTLEANTDDLKYVASLKAENGKTGLRLTTETADLAKCNIFIVTVPTPVDQFKQPDLGQLLAASEMLGKLLKPNDIVIYESTVYPGCTEEECVPVLEHVSSLKFNQDFFVGYSPERINPGDRVNILTTIKKITSGSTPQIADIVDRIYQSIITAGTHRAPSIKVAEAAKAIENAQRDLNISFVNELALIFDRIGIDTNDVIEAAGTKWNFLKYKPGLVGGHCIGIDPYYLAHKAQSVGYHPEVILSGRRVNDNMGVFVAGKVVKLLIKKGQPIAGAKVLILGVTFKENCADIRNSRVVDIYQELKEYRIAVDVFDPHANKQDVEKKYGIKLIDSLTEKKEYYNAIVLAVAHNDFLHINLTGLKAHLGIIYDTKAVLPRDIVDGRL